MALTINRALETALSGHETHGCIEVEEWGLGVDCKAGIHVLNLYAQGQNYPEIITPAAVAGFVEILLAASNSGAKAYYWPSDTAPVLFVGKFPLGA